MANTEEELAELRLQVAELQQDLVSERTALRALMSAQQQERVKAQQTAEAAARWKPTQNDVLNHRLLLSGVHTLPLMHSCEEQWDDLSDEPDADGEEAAVEVANLVLS